MAIDIPIDGDPVTASKIATWRVDVESPQDRPTDEWVLRGHRQIVDTRQSGAINVRLAPNMMVQRFLADIAAREFSVPDCPTVTGEQLFRLIGAAIDAIDAEQIQAAATSSGRAHGIGGATGIAP